MTFSEEPGQIVVAREVMHVVTGGVVSARYRERLLESVLDSNGNPFATFEDFCASLIAPGEDSLRAQIIDFAIDDNPLETLT